MIWWRSFVDSLLEVGGLFVSVFAIFADALEPKSFAGLLGAAPSVALATISLTVLQKGKPYAAIEAQSMVIGGRLVRDKS
jgi:hypothetical protein